MKCNYLHSSHSSQCSVNLVRRKWSLLSCDQKLNLCASTKFMCVSSRTGTSIIDRQTTPPFSNCDYFYSFSHTLNRTFFLMFVSVSFRSFSRARKQKKSGKLISRQFSLKNYFPSTASDTTTKNTPKRISLLFVISLRFQIL